MGIRKNKKSRKNKQKTYKMKGCSKNKTMKYHGGVMLNNLDLAFPTRNIPSIPNPNLAYSGNGGAFYEKNLYPGSGGAFYEKNLYPNNGIPRDSYPGWLTPSILRGGGTHRDECKCSSCKVKMKGGNTQMLYPNGLVGTEWKADFQWPGTSGITGNNSHYGNNTYNNDISRQMKDIGANFPFNGGSKKKNGKTKRQKGGTFLLGDLINTGRVIANNLGNTYNSLNGYSSAVSPLPYRNQLPNTMSLNNAQFRL